LSFVFVVGYEDSGLCDELITRPEESYRLFVFLSTCVSSRNVNSAAA